MSVAPKKRVSVTYVGDDAILQHILPINERKKSKVQKELIKTENIDFNNKILDGANMAALEANTSLRTPSVKNVKYEEIVEPEAEEENVDKKVFKHSEALTENTVIAGNEVFGFRTPKKSKQMAQKASDSARVASPKPQTPKSNHGTPTRRGAKASTNAPDTPVAQRASKRKQRLAAMTPQRLKARNKNDSSSEDSVSSEDGDDSENECEIKVVAKSTPTSTPKRGKARKQVDDIVKTQAVEEYFAAHSGSNTHTSDHTLSRLQTPRMDAEMLSAALQDVDAGWTREQNQLMDDYRLNFRQWMYYMCNGYNLLFHGVGSKRNLIEEFRLKMLKDFSHIVINGYFPSLTIKGILNTITDEILGYSGSFRTPVDQCEYIRTHYECAPLEEYEDFYLVIHNIDGIMLRPEKVQNVLSLLAQIRGFHVIASIDHINAPLVWDQTKLSRFKWLWHDVTTYASYTEETSFENSLLVQQSGSLALSSLSHVLRSLTPNARGIFLLLARHQLECVTDSSNYPGLAFTDLYQKCREAFLVNSDLTLHTQLTEYRDHKLVKTKKGYDGIEYLLIPLDPGTLKEFLEQQEE